MSKKKKNILVWGASFLVTEGLTSLLSNTGSFEVAGIAGSWNHLINVARNQEHDVLVVDAAAPEFDVAALKELINISNTPAVMLLLDNVTRNEFQKYSEAGIENLLLKDAPSGEIINATVSAANNRKFYSSEILEMILESIEAKQPDKSGSKLTPSEKEIVKLIAGGFTTKEIAAHRSVSFHTVNTHRKNIFRKLEVSNASELTMKAIKAGWIDNIEYYI